VRSRGREIWPTKHLTRALQGTFTCRKCTTWVRRLYFPYTLRIFISHKNPPSSAGPEPAAASPVGPVARTLTSCKPTSDTRNGLPLGITISKSTCKTLTGKQAAFVPVLNGAEARLNNIYNPVPYRKENTALHRYKDQPVNGCLRK
jgi:hypothetical protein